MAFMTSLFSIVPFLLASYLATSGSTAAPAVTVTVEAPSTAGSFPPEYVRLPEKV